jgi:hypothetical protein
VESLRDRPSFQTYYALIDRHMGAYLDKQDPSYLLQVDKEEYLDFLVAEASWELLTWDETGMTVEPFRTKVQRRGDFGDTYTADVEKLRIRIPVSPHSQREKYLEFMPSSFRYQREPNYRFDGDVLVLEVDATEQAVTEILEALRFWWGTRNKDIEKGNAELKQRIRPVWESRRERLEAASGTTQQLIARLMIPIHQDKNSESKPVQIRPRELRTTRPRPSAQPAAGEPSLDRDDVHALVGFTSS